MVFIMIYDESLLLVAMSVNEEDGSATSIPLLLSKTQKEDHRAPTGFSRTHIYVKDHRVFIGFRRKPISNNQARSYLAYMEEELPALFRAAYYPVGK